MIINDFFDLIDPVYVFSSFASVVGQFDGLFVWILTLGIFQASVHLLLYLFNGNRMVRD